MGTDAAPKLFPLGTSRLHWAAEYIVRHDAAQVLFPQFGYFQSPGQIRTIVEILSGARDVPDICHYLCRRDGTPYHPFDPRALTTDPDFWAQKRAEFADADAILLEMASPVEFRLGDLFVQGNPNHTREVPFAEIWKTGYYAVYEPEIDVRRETDTEADIADHFARIDELLGGRPAIVQSHIYRGQQDYGRRAFAGIVSRQAASLDWAFIDVAELCETHGFRILKNGQTDIHHLSWPGTRANGVLMLEHVFAGLGRTLPESTRAAILGDAHEMM